MGFPESVINRKLILRIPLAILLLSALFYIPDLYDHFEAHLSGGIMDSIITDQWWVVLVNILVFTSFLIPLTFRRKANWKEYGIVIAFFVSLFVEMYGIPLTVFFASRYLGGSEKESARTLFSVDVLGVDFAFSIGMIYGSILMILGTIIIVIGWVTLYRNLKKTDLVTSGIYSLSRHPQYLGFLLVIAGWVVGWPTLLTLIFGPILVVMYIRVCVKEEREMSRTVDYGEYRKRTPFMI
ncbi:MAG: methyltransferase family protein [Thermoplasmatota archaeon]